MDDTEEVLNNGGLCHVKVTKLKRSYTCYSVPQSRRQRSKISCLTH